jgi:hypothetical protein
MKKILILICFFLPLSISAQKRNGFELQKLINNCKIGELQLSKTDTFVIDKPLIIPRSMKIIGNWAFLYLKHDQSFVSIFKLRKGVSNVYISSFEFTNYMNR